MAETQRQFESTTQAIDFSDGLGDNFGVEETTELGKSQLDAFIFNTPTAGVDPTKIEKVDKQPEEPKKQVEESKKEEPLKKTAQEIAEEGSSLLKNFLTEESEEGKQNDSSTGDQSNEQTNAQASGDSEENRFSLLSKELYKLGVFTPVAEEGDDEPDITTGEDFLKRFKFEQQRGAFEYLDNYLNRFGPEYRQMFNSVFEKGVDPRDYIASFSKVESMKGLDLSKPENQEKVFTQYFRSQGLSEERIQKRLEKAKDYGDLADDAQEMHELMIQKEEANIAELEQRKTQELAQKQQREQYYQENMGKILQAKMKAGDFDGIPVTQKEAIETFNYLTDKPYRLPDGKLISEFDKDIIELDKPENFELKAKVALLLRNKMDLTKVKKRAVSKEADGLFSSLTNTKKAQIRTEGKSNPMRSFFD